MAGFKTVIVTAVSTAQAEFHARLTDVGLAHNVSWSEHADGDMVSMLQVQRAEVEKMKPMPAVEEFVAINPLRAVEERMFLWSVLRD